MEQRKTGAIVLCVLSLMASAPIIFHALVGGFINSLLLKPGMEDKLPKAALIFPLITGVASASFLLVSISMKSRAGLVFLLIAVGVSALAIVLY